MTDEQILTIVIEIQAILNAIKATTYRPRLPQNFKEIRLLAAKAERGTK